MNKAFVGLGSNIGSRAKYLEDAIQLLDEHSEIQVTKKSSIYETEPVGYLDQEAFLNMVIEVETTLVNLDLLAVCQGIEKELGRKRTVINGPRTVDLDILLFNNENRTLEKLIIPHPRLKERAFVLVPLGEIAPNRKIPTDGQVVKDVLEKLSERDLRGVVKWEASD